MNIASRSTPLLLAIVVACSGSPAPETPAPFDPSGRYDFTVEVADGVSIPGVLRITRTGDAFHTFAAVEGEPNAAEGDSIEVTGQHVILHTTAGPEGEPVTFHLDFTATGFTGAVATGEGSIPITGTRRNP